MFKFFRKSLKVRLVSLFLLGTLVPVVAMLLVSYHFSSQSLEENALDQLKAVREIKKNQILQYFEQCRANVDVMARSESARIACDLLRNYHDEGGGRPDGTFDVESVEYREVTDRIDPFFKRFAQGHGFHSVYLICREHGHVMYSLARESDTGVNLESGSQRDSNLADLWKKTTERRQTTLNDFRHYEPSGQPAAFLGAPVSADTGEFDAVLAVQVDIRPIDLIMQEHTGMGRTGETYLVGADKLMRSDSRFENATILRKRIDTDAVRSGLRQESGTRVIEGSDGETVISSFAPVGLGDALGTDFDWVICSEKDSSEAFAPVRALGTRIAWIGAILAILTCCAGFLAAASITAPLRELSGKVAQMAEGDLTVETSFKKRSDEIGLLQQSFGDMIRTLRAQTQELTGGAHTLAYSIGEISATAAQLAASARETSTSVSEITTTVEEVKQTSSVSCDRAGGVATRAEEVSRVSSDGRRVTDEAVDGMGRIKNEMEYVADSIVKLSDQTHSISQIIGAVHGLADQSNLLSVNASIEAAKAGEYGKGFAVVAQEVKTLADQSKEATDQVKGILSEIQKATSAAVMATERGNKAVDAGVTLSTQAGETIGQLVAGVSDSNQAVAQIAASSQEQLVGIEQLAVAMESIREAANQNVDGARQLEDATSDLNTVAQRLKDLADHYKV